MPTRAVCWFVQFAVFLSLWLLFVASLAGNEFVIGIAAAAVAATVGEAVRGAEHPRFRPQIRWLLEFRHIPAAILADCGRLTRSLVRTAFLGDRRTGRLLSVPFHAGDRGAASITRRALATMYSTFPPNTIVIGIDRKRGRMLLHRLEPAAPPLVSVKLGGRQ